MGQPQKAEGKPHGAQHTVKDRVHRPCLRAQQPQPRRVFQRHDAKGLDQWDRLGQADQDHDARRAFQHRKGHQKQQNPQKNPREEVEILLCADRRPAKQIGEEGVDELRPAPFDHAVELSVGRQRDQDPCRIAQDQEIGYLHAPIPPRQPLDQKDGSHQRQDQPVRPDQKRAERQAIGLRGANDEQRQNHRFGQRFARRIEGAGAARKGGPGWVYLTCHVVSLC